nr:hypothetical protein [Photobacterium sp.]
MSAFNPALHGIERSVCIDEGSGIDRLRCKIADKATMRINGFSGMVAANDNFFSPHRYAAIGLSVTGMRKTVFVDFFFRYHQRFMWRELKCFVEGWRVVDPLKCLFILIQILEIGGYRVATRKCEQNGDTNI